MAIKLGDLLVRAQLISREQLNAALEHQAAYGGRLGEVLVLSGFVSEEVLVRALSKLTGIPRADLSGEPDPAAIARVSRAVAEQSQLVPIAFGEDGRLRVAASDPQSADDLERVQAAAGCEVVPLFATVGDIRAARDRWYPAAPTPAAEAQPTAQEQPLQPEIPVESAPSEVNAEGRTAQSADEAHEAAGAPGLLSLRSGRRAVAALALVSLLLIAAVVYVAQLRARVEAAGQGLEAHLRTIALQAQQVEALDQLATRVDQFNREFGGLEGRLQVDDLEIGVQRLQKGDLPAQAKQILAEFEKSTAELRSMETQLKEWQAYLGAPTLVKRGDTHAQLALNYLTRQAGLPQAQAEAVVRQTALAWDIEPGNQVYSLYRDGILLSTVTQGTAARPPLLAQWAQRRASQSAAQALETKLRECEAKEAPKP